ncbi:unnamed protein product [Ixodes persulcatus]
MLSQLCRAQLWPKPSNKWNRRFPTVVRGKAQQQQMDSPNIVHFNCSTNNLQGISDPGDSSCCSDEENDCSGDSCSEYSCAVSIPLKREYCCCCQAAENPAYGLSTSQPALGPTEVSRTSHSTSDNEDDAVHWLSRERPRECRTSPVENLETPQEDSFCTAAPIQPSERSGSTDPAEEDKVTRLRGMLNGGNDSPSAFRVVVPKKNIRTLDVRPAPRQPARLQQQETILQQPTVQAKNARERAAHPFDPLSVRVELDYPPALRLNDIAPPSTMHDHDNKLQRAPAKLKRFSICEADGLLQSASAQNPTQVPMVVMQCARLHLSIGASPPYQQTSLPMGTLVTALYRDQDWICVQTPHGVSGFLYHASCMPLGILPTFKKANSLVTGVPGMDVLTETHQPKDEKKMAADPGRQEASLDKSRPKKRSNVSLQGRSAERCISRSKVDNRHGRRGSRVAPTSKTNVECVRATLQRNMADQKVPHNSNHVRGGKKVLEKNIDKLILASKDYDDIPGTKLLTALKALRIEAAVGFAQTAQN